MTRDDTQTYTQTPFSHRHMQGMGGGAKRRMRSGEMYPTLAVGWQASVMRGEEAGCFCKVAGVSIIAANSRQPSGLNKDKTTHISVRLCKFCDICVMHGRYTTILLLLIYIVYFKWIIMFAAMKQRTMTSLWPSCVCIHTNEILQIIQEGGVRGKGSKRSLLITYQLVVFCNHSLHCFLLVRAPEAPLMTGWLPSGSFLSMISVRELGSEGDEGEVCARKDHPSC